MSTFSDGDDSDTSKSLGEVVSSLCSSAFRLKHLDDFFPLLFWFVLRQDLTM